MIKKGDFVEIEYDGRLKDGNLLFDTTKKEVAKKENLYNPNMKYESAKICVGENHLIPGLDADLEGKEIGKEFSVEIAPENAFGKKDAKRIQLLSLSKFKKENINPMPGMQVEIDDTMGVVKTVTGGRVMVDFNHPLSGKEVIYTYKVNKIIEDETEKIKAYFYALFNVDVNVEKNENTFTIESKTEMPDELKAKFTDKLKEIISDKYDYKFKAEEKPKK